MINKIFLIAISLFFVFSNVGCIKKIALNKVASALTADGGTVFTGDNDPQLIKDALPFSLKTYESLLASMPENQDLLLATGKAFCMYSYAFIHAPADTLADEMINEQTVEYQRAKKMYLRAWKYLIKALDLRYPGIEENFKTNNFKDFISKTTEEDLDLLYWTGMSWMGAFTVEIFDISVKVHTDKAVAMLERVLELKEDYGKGSIHDFFISYSSSALESSGGNTDKARGHFNRAIELCQGRRAGPYVALAQSVSKKENKPEEFKELLNKALSINPEDDPENTLVNIISQAIANWLLRNIEDHFLLDTEEEEETDFSDEEF